MKILKARDVKWVQYLNPPMTELLVDKIPDHEGMIYDVVEAESAVDPDLSAEQGLIVNLGFPAPKPRPLPKGSAFYFAEKEGYVSFFFHNPANQEGYGGHVFNLTLRDGSKRAIKGPWSSNSAAMKSVGFPETAAVSITDRPDVYERGYTFMAAHVTKEFLDSFGPREYIEKGQKA